MINRILERLEAEADKSYNAYTVGFISDDRAEYDAYTHAIEIVQEVAKEYDEKKYYRITLSCLEDITNLEMPLTKQEYLFLTRLSELVYRVATGCMPTMYVEQKGE